MDEGVAYMVMGEGGEMTQVAQPTQVVAIDNGDGTQQFAIPVIDQETGQESYMIIDPETAQNITNGGAAGQQLMVVNSEAGGAEMVTGDQVAPAEGVIVDTGAVAESGQENMMVMLPNGEQGMVVSSEEYNQIMQQVRYFDFDRP